MTLVLSVIFLLTLHFYSIKTHGTFYRNHCWLFKWHPTCLPQVQSVLTHPICKCSKLAEIALEWKGNCRCIMLGRWESNSSLPKQICKGVLNPVCVLLDILNTWIIPLIFFILFCHVSIYDTTLVILCNFYNFN